MEEDLTSTGGGMRLDRVCFGYTRDRLVIDGCTAELLKGRVCALVGPNAAGKTTLLRLMLGQEAPRSGSVILDGTDLSRFTPRQRSGRISFVPQGSSTGFAFTVRQVVEMGRLSLPHRPDIVDRALKDNDLSHVTERVYAHLSAGQQQRVLLARAFAQAGVEMTPGDDPGETPGRIPGEIPGGGDIMLLDEPTSALDLKHVHRAMADLVRFARSGIGVLVVLHDLNLAGQYADSVWVMDRGRIVAQGPVGRVLVPEVLEPIYGVRLKDVTKDLRSGESGRPVYAVDPVMT